MHLVFFMRGIYSQIEILKTQLQCTFWKWKRINLDTGQEETILVQGALRPSVLGAWEYVFPEECLAEVLCVMGIKGEEYTHSDRFKDKLRLSFLRKVFGVKKIPKSFYEEAAKIPPTLIINGVMRGLSHCIIASTAIHCIGIKADDRRDFDFTNVGLGRYNQEAL
jgi:hypothetical protein